MRTWIRCYLRKSKRLPKWLANIENDYDGIIIDRSPADEIRKTYDIRLPEFPLKYCSPSNLQELASVSLWFVISDISAEKCIDELDYIICVGGAQSIMTQEQLKHNVRRK